MFADNSPDVPKAHLVFARFESMLKALAGLNEELRSQLEEVWKGHQGFWKAVRYLDPRVAGALRPTFDSVQKHVPQLRNVPKEEWGAYLVLCTGSPPTSDVRGWWERHRAKMPSLSVGALCALHIPPTATSADSIFSLVDAFFGDRRGSMSPDVRKMTLFLLLNKHHFQPLLNVGQGLLEGVA
eukprot:Sspe_Gene.49778::Locus_27116_Transcript_1_1_Confidence_1.000_Length_910::g.49778::m.49778